MLAGVLLHVIQPARRIDLALHRRSHRDGFADEVQNRAVVIPIQHVDDVASTQAAAIEGLATGCGIEGGAIEDHEGAALESAGLDHCSGESKERAVVVVKPFGHGLDDAQAKAWAYVPLCRT